MRVSAAFVTAILLFTALMCGCGGAEMTIAGSGGGTTIAAPAIATTSAQNGAVIVSLTSTAGATIYYTLDGSAPTPSSQQYQGPFLVASNLTVDAIAVASGSSSSIASEPFTPNIPSGTLVWSDEFLNSTATPTQPDPTVWTYDTGNSGFGNNELENYCAWGSSSSPCSTSSPSEYVGSYPGTDGVLYIVAQQPSPGVYTSARLKSQGLFSFQYGRLEVRAQVPEDQGFWPAAWLMGNNIATLNWPACGEQDVMERVNVALTPDWNQGSIHGTGFTGANLGTTYYFATGQTAGGEFHNYGMIWSPGSVAYYIDDPNNSYATFTPSSISTLPGAVWPFDAGQSNFILLNLAIGGDYPGSPDGTTVFPSQMLIDYVRIYTN
jgi:beta-glucanase (GH16 family)